MGKLSVIEYVGDDAGDVLVRLIMGGGLDEPDGHDLESEVETAPFKTGFQPAELDGDDPEEGDDAL